MLLSSVGLVGNSQSVTQKYNLICGKMREHKTLMGGN